MKATRSLAGFHGLGLTGILQGYDISAKVYSLVLRIEIAIASVKGATSQWVANSRGRKELARLDARMLRDIGLEPFEVQREINKPFWRS